MHAVLVALLCMSAWHAARAWAADSAFVHCRVFEDADSSGVYDPGEALLAGIRITDGVGIVMTDAQGEADLWIDRARYRFATLIVPAGSWPTTRWYHWVPAGSTGPDTVAFGLAASPATAADVDSIRWVHISDTHVRTWGDPLRMDTDLAQIDAIADRPLFVINTGDLVDFAADSTQWQNYVSQLSATSLRVFPVVGNHDVTTPPAPLESFERYLGPPYYSFDAGRWHFVVYNDCAASVATPAEDAWMAADIAAAPHGSLPIVFKHYMVQELAVSTIEAWASMGIVAGFSGHWHSLQFSERAQGILEFNLGRMEHGPLDRTPRAFGIVSCTRSGQVHYDLRRLDVDHRAFLSAPQANQVLAREPMDVFAQAYDTSSRAASMVAALSGTGGSVPATALAREGISLWRGTLDVSTLPEGLYDLTVTGAFEDGWPIALHAQVELRDVVPIRRSPDGDWPMFRKCPAGSSFVSSSLQPPLSLAWATPVPGMIAQSSPVVKGGCVYMGCRAERDMGEAGVLACDAATGAVRWFTHVPGGVALAPAVAGDVVIATAMTDSVFGLDAQTGSRLWSVPQVNARYSLAAPIVEGARAWVGAEPRPMQVQASTGSLDWRAAWLGDPWFPYMYSAPAVDEERVAWGFFGAPPGGDMPATTGGLRILSRTAGALVYAEEGAFRSPVQADGGFYVVGGADRNHQQLTARTPTGAVLWTSPAEVGSGIASPALAHGILVVPGGNGAIKAYRVSDGAALWSKSVGLEIYEMETGLRVAHATSASPAITDSTVWVGSLDGNLYALDLATGTEKWRWRFGVPIASSAAVSGNMLFVGVEDEHLYAFAGAGVGPETGASSSERALEFSFSPPRPNPSTTSTRFAWRTEAAVSTRLRVFDVSGRLVRTLVDGVLPPGEHEIAWDGRDGRGARAAAGVFYARLDAGDRSAVQRFVRLRPR
jgi:outer membrane protein assembly factor BamB